MSAEQSPAEAAVEAPTEARMARWAGVLFAVCAVLMVPWVAVIAVTLPSRHLSAHYDLAWAGFDTMLLVALATTAVSAWRRSRRLALTASWSAALLVADAWFDVVNAASRADRLEAIAMAALVELPLAITCLWFSWHAQDIADDRLRLRGRGGGEKESEARLKGF